MWCTSVEAYQCLISPNQAADRPVLCQIAEHQRGLDARREIRIGLPVVRLSGLAVAMNQPSAKRQIADRWRHRGHTIEQGSTDELDG